MLTVLVLPLARPAPSWFIVAVRAVFSERRLQGGQPLPQQHLSAVLYPGPGRVHGFPCLGSLASSFPSVASPNVYWMLTDLHLESKPERNAGPSPKSRRGREDSVGNVEEVCILSIVGRGQRHGQPTHPACPSPGRDTSQGFPSRVGKEILAVSWVREIKVLSFEWGSF